VTELAERHHLGLPIDAEDPDSIADAVRKLSETPGLAAEYRANVEEARTVLSWEHEEERLAAQVDSLLDGRGRRARKPRLPSRVP
jgi:hypothetical protein